MQIRTLAAALLLSTSAAAETVEYPAPVAVPHGLIFYPDPIEGKHAFGPADGVDVLPGGKADWTAPPSARASVTRPGRGITNSAYVLSGVAGYIAVSTPRFSVDLPCWCQGSPVTADPPETDHPAPVPLPAALLMLLTGFGLLRLFRRNDPKKEMRKTIAQWANDQPQDWGGEDP